MIEEAAVVQIPRDEVLQVLRRAGLSESADELARLLPETIDLDRDGELLTRHGLNHDDLISRLGGSP
jgi:hypothetical protein